MKTFSFAKQRCTVAIRFTKHEEPGDVVSESKDNTRSRGVRRSFIRTTILKRNRPLPETADASSFRLPACPVGRSLSRARRESRREGRGEPGRRLSRGPRGRPKPRRHAQHAGSDRRARGLSGRSRCPVAGIPVPARRRRPVGGRRGPGSRNRQQIRFGAQRSSEGELAPRPERRTTCGPSTSPA